MMSSSRIHVKQSINTEKTEKTLNIENMTNVVLYNTNN